jgi:hypothetical protein
MLVLSLEGPVLHVGLYVALAFMPAPLAYRLHFLRRLNSEQT